MNPPSVLIVGAGPVGLTAALTLTRHNISCRLIDINPHAVNESRALAMQSRTLEVAERLGVVNRLFEKGGVGRGGRLFAEGREKVHVDFTSLDCPFPCVLFIEQSHTERVLGGLLKELGVPIERPLGLASLSQDTEGVSAILRHADGREESARYDYLIGCDGAHSLVRKQIGLTFAGEAAPGTFLLADVHVDAPGGWPTDEVRIYTGKAGLFLAFPISEGRFRIISTVDDVPGQQGPPPTPTLAEIQTLTDQRVGPNIRLHDPVWLSAFRVSSRVVDRLRVGRVFVAGDAAHIHSPAGGQGMNTGMQDVFNLGWKLALNSRGRGGEPLLDSYHAERHPNALSLLRATELATKVMTNHGTVASNLRSAVLTVLGKLEFVPEKMALEMSELPINYRESPLSMEWKSGIRVGPHAGDRAPDAEGLCRFPGQTRRLFQWWGQDMRHQLLIFAGLEPSSDRAKLMAIARQLNSEQSEVLNAMVIHPGTGKSGDDPVLFDSSRSAHDRYGAEHECIYLIRPDGYIGMRSAFADLEPLRDYLAKHLSAT